MATIGQIRRFRRLLIYLASALLAVFFILLIFVDRFVEPILRDRIHTLIVEGSDSLYTYKLGDLKANFFGGKVEVRNLQINIDSNRYQYLRDHNRLPVLTMQLDLELGSIKGINILSLVFGKKISVEELRSKKADIKLSRHLQVKGSMESDQPLWKSIQPKIQSIVVDRIKLDGVKMLYKNADTSESVKLQFDECNALFEDIRIDSASFFDTTRIGFTKNISLRFHDLKFRTADSSYKMKAEWITYSSRDNILEVDSFKLQPTLEKEDFYKSNPVQQTLYYVEFQKVRFVNTRLDRFINNDVINADSLIFLVPNVSMYMDRTMQPVFQSKIGNYPHQKLLASSSVIDVKTIVAQHADLLYTEKNAKTLQEGKVAFNDFDLVASNITNDRRLIAKNNSLNVAAHGKILGSSEFSLNFKFFLDSVNGSYESWGHIKNISTEQLRPLGAALANVQINSFNIHNIDFSIRGRDYDASGNVKMRYNGLSLTLKKLDEETGEVKTKKFLTKILNKFVMWSDNPGPDGIERTSNEAKALRLSTQSFFGLLWKTIFDGMQDIMMKSGRYG